MKLTYTIPVVLMLLSAGCLYSGQNSHHTDVEFVDPQPGSGSIDYAFDKPPVTDSQFRFEGAVIFDYATDEGITYDHVMLCLYDRNGSVLKSMDLGTFETPHTHANVSIRSQEIPKYVVLDHPKLREDGFRDILKWDAEQQVFKATTTDDIEFDYPRSDVAGECS